MIRFVKLLDNFIQIGYQGNNLNPFKEGMGPPIHHGKQSDHWNESPSCEIGYRATTNVRSQNNRPKESIKQPPQVQWYITTPIKILSMMQVEKHHLSKGSESTQQLPQMDDT